MRKQNETDPVSVHFASKRKNILCETGAPFTKKIDFVIAHFCHSRVNDFAVTKNDL
jgi:hypothetical protein